VDGKIRAHVFALAVEHADWGSRRLAREAGASRRSVQRWLAAEGLRGSGAAASRVGPYAAVRAPAGLVVPVVGLGPADRPVALSAVRPMTEEDHVRFEADRPVSGWWSSW
jgi:hypothetical protein